MRKKKKRKAETHTGKRPYDDRGRDWSDASTSQEMPRISSNYQKLEETRKDPSLKTSEGTWPYQNLDFGLPAFKIVRK